MNFTPENRSRRSATAVSSGIERSRFPGDPE
jgi:hypothetical protein